VSDQFSVKLVGITKPEIWVENGIDQRTLTAEEMIAYCARVSNPSNQTNTDSMPKLLKYLRDHSHWSPFEMVSASLEVETSRGIAPQILRHRSFSFQEFSQRYAAVDDSGVVIYAARRQDDKNRQNSIDDLPDEVKSEWMSRQLDNWRRSFDHYTWALNNGIAKECARMVLPLGAKTKLYMSGSIRSWIHYCEVRCDVSTQLEHREIAIACRDALRLHFPNTFGV
jgi:thymidylate synthase (FAD)